MFSHLLEFVQFGEVGDRRQTHVNQTEELQVHKLRRQTLDLPLIRATVIKHQLTHLTHTYTQLYTEFPLV